MIVMKDSAMKCAPLACVRALMLTAFVCGAVLALSGCGQKTAAPPAGTVVIGIPTDVNAFNPLFATDVMAEEINELIFPMLVNSEFDTTTGTLTYTPGLARSWEWRSNGADLVFHLHRNACWSDSVRISARDVQFTFELCADPDVESVWQNAVEGLRRTADGMLDVRSAVQILDDSTVVFHFSKAYPGQLFDVGIPVIPEHIFAAMPRSELRSHPVNQAPIGAGPFRLIRHTTMQEIVLGPNPLSVLPFPSHLQRLVFRVVPDHRSRILQLISGEIDMMSGIEPDDATQISREAPDVQLIPTAPRRYHFIGWNNIDPAAWAESHGTVVRPHPLFGSVRVRQALTMAVNRADLTRAFAGRDGIEAVGPVSPMFRAAYNDSLRPLPYDPARAAALLTEEGWTDSDGDGILDRRGVRFSFILKVPSGNGMWSEIATVVQKQLRDIHVDARIEFVERSVFWPDLLAKKYDAWIAGFEVPLEMRLDDMWGSDLQKNPFNVLSYRQPAVDRLLKHLRTLRTSIGGAADIRAIQTLIAEDQPCTFLFWERGMIGLSRRVRGVHSTVLAMTHDAWNWETAPASGR